MQHKVLCRKIIAHGWDVAVHIPGWVWPLRELGGLSLEKRGSGGLFSPSQLPDRRL